MATLAQLRSDLRTWTSTHANPAILPDAVCDQCINAAVDLMQEAHLWRYQEWTETIAYPGNTEWVYLPDSFISQRAVYLDTTASTPLGPMSTPLAPVPLAYIEKTILQEWLRNAQSAGERDPDYPQIAPVSARGCPVQYAIYGEALYLLPAPSQDVQVVIDYYSRVAPLATADSSNIFTRRYPHVIRSGALADAYAYLQEDERSGTYRQLFEATLTRAILDDKTLMLAGGSTSRGV
jgi:hypothetical protein